MTTLRDAFAPHLADAHRCACATCLAVADQRVELWAGSQIKDVVAYWAAVSEQLRQLSSGEHRRVEWDDYVRTLPPAPEDANPTVSTSSGLHLGFGSGLHDRPHPPWVLARVYAEPADPTEIERVTAPVQLDLFAVAA